MMHETGCAYHLGLACTCHLAERTVEQWRTDAQTLTAFLTGWLAVAVHKLADPAQNMLDQQPMQVEYVGPEGVIRLRLGNGMVAVIGIGVHVTAN